MILNNVKIKNQKRHKVSFSRMRSLRFARDRLRNPEIATPRLNGSRNDENDNVK